VGQAALGAVIGVAVNALVLPPVHLRDVRENLAALAREAGEALHAVAAGLRDGEWDAGTAADWSHRAARLEQRRQGLRSARGWSRESLRLTAGPLRALHRVPLDVPPESEDARWGRVADHVTALTRTLAVAADDDRSPAPPEAAALRAYARLLELIGDVCEAEAGRLPGPWAGARTGAPTETPEADGVGAGTVEGRSVESEMEELRARLQGDLRDHAGQGAAPTAVLGTLLLQAENLWAEVLPGTRQKERTQ
jgi:hypothetical protein